MSMNLHLPPFLHAFQAQHLTRWTTKLCRPVTWPLQETREPCLSSRGLYIDLVHGHNVDAA